MAKKVAAKKKGKTKKKSEESHEGGGVPAVYPNGDLGTPLAPDNPGTTKYTLRGHVGNGVAHKDCDDGTVMTKNKVIVPVPTQWECKIHHKKEQLFLYPA